MPNALIANYVVSMPFIRAKAKYLKGSVRFINGWRRITLKMRRRAKRLIWFKRLMIDVKIKVMEWLADTGVLVYFQGRTGQASF